MHSFQKYALHCSFVKSRNNFPVNVVMHVKFNPSVPGFAYILMSVLQCTTITSCGNFVLIGYSSGHVDKYNIQSGLLRGTYGMKEGMHTLHKLNRLRKFCSTVLYSTCIQST